MKIKVTRQHRLEGVRCAVACCPIALAAREQHGILEEDIDVDRHRIMARDARGKMRRYRVPQQAQEWMETFDFGTRAEREALPEFEFTASRL